ncbi:ATPase P [Olsenella phocaeensis]|uniref:ATPase P n=1 Tax=Olsenella phocaeensis TaxID=1852385 RepID=UPI003A8FB2BE
MIRIDIPGREELGIDHLVLDFNGTIAADGRLVGGVAERIALLSDLVDVIVLTADTYGSAAAACEGLPLRLLTFPSDSAGLSKEEIVRSLGGGVCCVGNGYNDIGMFDLAALRIAVVGEEGVCAALLGHADVLVPGPCEALDLLLRPSRLRATLRA